MKTINVKLTREEAHVIRTSLVHRQFELENSIKTNPDIEGAIKEHLLNIKLDAEDAMKKIEDALRNF